MMVANSGGKIQQVLSATFDKTKAKPSRVLVAFWKRTKQRCLFSTSYLAENMEDGC